jgi:hypothetical protein
VNADQLPSEPNRPPNVTDRARRRTRSELLKRGLFGAAVLATLVALAFGLDRWHAKRTLVEWLREQESRGERFDPASVIPPPVPDDQNMLATPLFMDRFEIWRALASIPEEDRDGPPPLLNLWRSDGPPGPGVGSGFETGRRIDLAAMQDYYRRPPTRTRSIDPLMMDRYGIRPDPPPLMEPPTTPARTDATPEFPVRPEPETPARDVLHALSRYDAELTELRQAAQRPHFRMPLDYQQLATEGELLAPSLISLRSIVRFLVLRSVANMADDRMDEAFLDTQLGLRIVEGMGSEPLQLPFLMRLSTHVILLHALWEGMVDQRWSSAHLETFQEALLALDFVEHHRRALRGHRALYSIAELQETFERYQTHPDLRQPQLDPNQRTAIRSWFQRVSKGRIHRNALARLRLYQMTLELEPGGVRATLDAYIASFTPAEPNTVLARFLAPGLVRSLDLSERVQTYTHLAAIACALERHRLQTGEYPDHLTALEPQFMTSLPLDFMSGQPYQYRRTEPGRYLLYSVGANRQDNGGTPSRTYPDHDWVWFHPGPAGD